LLGNLGSEPFPDLFYPDSTPKPVLGGIDARRVHCDKLLQAVISL